MFPNFLPQISVMEESPSFPQLCKRKYDGKCLDVCQSHNENFYLSIAFFFFFLSLVGVSIFNSSFEVWLAEVNKHLHQPRFLLAPL